MGKRVILLSAILSLCIASGSAQQTNDSLMIDGKSYTLHKVEKGETLYSVCGKYKVDMTEVAVLNKMGESGYSLSAGQILIIPLYARKPLVDTKSMKVSDDGYITHVVKQGETLYSISRSYNGVTPQMLKEKNNLTSDALKVNQKLLIPQEINPKAVYKEAKKDDSKKETVKNKDAEALEKQYSSSETTAETVDISRGVATWLDNDQDENMKNFYALHKFAPIGTILKVRNLMNNRTAYVKVIGKLPDNEENKSVVIKISGAAARQLHVLDAKFLVELTIPQSSAQNSATQ